MKPFIYILFIILLYNCSSDESIVLPEEDPNSKSLYFPPINSSEWETKSISDLNWNASQLEPLLNFLEEKNTKSFMVLHQGKIVIEEYFQDHTETSPWY